MLHLITKKQFTKPKLKLPFIAGVPIPISFDPLTLATYQAGYLMNYENDVIPGSMLSTAHSQWMDAVLLNITAKYLQSNTDNVPVIVNGFKSFAFNLLVADMRVILNDLFTGINDYTLVIGFQRGKSLGSNHIVFYEANTAHNQETWLNIQPGGTLDFLAGDGHGGSGNNISATSLFSYDDSLPHIAICRINQTTKTIDLFTDLGEHIIATNAAYVPQVMTTTSPFDVHFGQWYDGTLLFNPGGLLFDMFLYSSVLSIADINKLMSYEANRLGIAYVPF